MISALFVIKDGHYFNQPGIDPWDIERDAKKYLGPNKVIAHPPCQRWGRYWGGGPMLHGTKHQKLLGQDEGCFAHALWSVRTFGGVLEHPEASHAFHYYGLAIPKRLGGWTEPDRYGGRSCCVAQGNYGHRSQKLTWLYGVGIKYKELAWGLTPGKLRLEDGFHSNTERIEKISRPRALRISQMERESTPKEFIELLRGLVK